MIRTAYSPSALSVFSSLCPAALDFYQERQDGIGPLYAAGNAAHAVLEDIGHATRQQGRCLTPEECQDIAYRTCVRLIAAGKQGDNKPLPPEQVYEGRDLALNYVERHPLTPGAEYEIAIAFDRAWQITGWESDKRRFRLVWDVLEFFEDGDEEQVYTVAQTTDYKSNWQTDESELDTIQMRAQAVAAVRLYGDRAQILRQRVVNLRTGQIYSRDINLSEETERLVEWKRDLEALMQAADRPRVARTGMQCMGCPFIARCDAVKAALVRSGLPETPEDMARQFAALKGMLDVLTPLLKEHVAAAGAIDIGDATLGMVTAEERKVPADKALAVLAQWTERGGDAAGLLTAMGGVGTTQLEKVGKVLFPDRKQVDARREWIAAHCVTTISERFQFARKGGE